MHETHETEIATGRCAVCRVYVERAELRKTLEGVLHCVACPPPRVAAPPIAPPPPPTESGLVDLSARYPFATMIWPRGFKAAAYAIAATIAAFFVAACASQT